MKNPFLFLLYGVSFAFPVFLSLFLPVEYGWCAITPGIVLYCCGIRHDVKSTISFGQKVVMKLESSIIFSFFTQFGFVRAILVQVSVEMVMAVVLFPLFLARFFDPGVIGIMLGVFGAIHVVCGMQNNTLYNTLHK